MVDSAVTLSIGTELDLSGLQRDLAALKNQKIDFNVDLQGVSSQFKTVQQGAHLKPTVDLSELHELNALLDVKLAHFKQVQNYFKSNPLKISVDNSSKQFVESFKGIKGGTVKIQQDSSLFSGAAATVVGNIISTEISRQLEKRLRTGIRDLFSPKKQGRGKEFDLLKAIEKNTKKEGALGGIRKGFQEGIGFYTSQRFAKGFYGQIDAALEKAIGETTEKSGEKVGQAAIKAVSIGSAAFVKATLGRDIEDLAAKVKQTKNDIAEFTDPDEVKAAESELVDALANLIQKGTGRTAKEEAPAAFQDTVAALKKQREPISNALRARQDERIRSAVDLAQEIASQLDFSNLEMGDVVITIGGYAGQKGTSSERIAEKATEALGVQSVASPNIFTDLPVEAADNPLLWALGAGGRAAEMKLLEPINPDAIQAAAKAIAIKRDQPSANVNLLGYSAGGFVTEQALDILGAAGMGQIGGTSVATPIGVGLRPDLPEDQFRTFFGESDPIKYLVKPLEAIGLAEAGGESMRFPGIASHAFESYMGAEEIRQSITRPNVERASRAYMARERRTGDAIQERKEAPKVSPQLIALQSSSEELNAAMTQLLESSLDIAKSFELAKKDTADLAEMSRLSAMGLTELEGATLLASEQFNTTESALTPISQQIEQAIAAINLLESSILSFSENVDISESTKTLEQSLSNLQSGFTAFNESLAGENLNTESLGSQFELLGGQVLEVTSQLEALRTFYNKQIELEKKATPEPIANEDTVAAMSLLQDSILQSTQEFSSLTPKIKESVEAFQIWAQSLVTSNSQTPMEAKIPLDMPIQPEKELVEIQKAAVEIQNVMRETPPAPSLKKEDVFDPNIFSDVSREFQSLEPTVSDLQKTLASDEFSAEGLRKLARAMGVPRSDLYPKGKAIKKAEIAERLPVTYPPQDILKTIDQLGAEIRNKSFLKNMEGELKVRPILDEAKIQPLLDRLEQGYKDVSSKIKLPDAGQFSDELIAEIDKALMAIEELRRGFQIKGSAANKLTGRQTSLQELKIAAEEAKANWQKTQVAVQKNIENIEKTSDKLGYEIQKDISEGSPGTTQRIRDHWRRTAVFVTDEMGDIASAAEQVSRNIEREGLFNPEFAVEEDINAKIGEIKPPKGLRETFDDIAEQITGISRISQKSGKEILNSFKENLQTEAVMKAFGNLKAAVQKSLSDAFGGTSVQGDLSRFIQGLTGRLVAGLTDLTALVVGRLGGVFVALKDSLAGAIGLVDDFVGNLAGNLIKLGKLVAQAFVLTKLVQGTVALGRASFQTALEVEQLTRSLSFSTADGGIATLEKIRQKANELNVSFIDAAEGYSQLAASTLGTRLEGQTENIFEGVATAISARGLSNENQSRAFLAISQIASKGRVSLEELNGQLGEALPGALQTAARALGVTSQELIKMVETGQLTAEEFLPKFAAQLSLEAGSSVAAAAGSATAQLTKFDNQLTQIRANIGKGVLDALAKVLPIVNAGLQVISDNTGLFTSVATVLASVLAINLGKALLTVASQLKIVNLLMSVFGISIAPATSIATKKATFAINGMNLSLAGTSTALKALAAQALPLLAIAAAFNTIRSVVTPLNEDIAKTTRGFSDIATKLERQRKSSNKDSGDTTGIQSTFQEFESIPRVLVQSAVVLDKISTLGGIFRRDQSTLAAELFLQLSKQAREAARAVEEVQAQFQPLSAEATARLQEIDDEAKKLRVQINVESGRGGDTSALQEQLNLLQDQRREILGSVQGYDDAVAVSQQLEDAIANLNKQYEDNKISTSDYNQELGFLQSLQDKNQGLLNQYAESTNTITTNVQQLASNIRSVTNELDKARGDAERTATAAQTALIEGRLSGSVSASDFALQQSAITAQQTQAIAAATETAKAKSFAAIRELDQAVVGQLEVAFGGAGFTGGLSQVLSEATTESLEQAKTAFQTAGGDIDPTGEAAINAIQQYIELRDQSLGLEKEIAELELDRRQQVADSLQEEIDLQNNRAQSAIEVASLQSQVSLTAKQAASELSSFDVELANFAEQARAARAEAGRLSASAQENRLAAQNQDLLPGDRERFIQTATREALEAQLKEQEAVLAETQARIATALRPVELGEQAAQIREQELQVTNAIRENLAASSKALSDFDRQIIGFGNSISQLIEEATNLESGAIAKRTAAENVALPPDERQRLLREATADDLLAQQKRSEAELQRVEAGRVTQLREVELATKAAQFANTEYYQSRRIAILAEQANAKTADEIATAAIISQKKQLDLEIEFTQRKIALNRQELTQQRDLYRQGVIDLDTFNERVIALDEERLQLQEQAVDQRIQLNQREIDNLNTLKEQLRSLDQIRSSVVEAQLNSQQRLIQSANVYGDALSQQAELIRVAADAQRQANEAAIAGAEADNARLGERRGLIDSLRSALGLKEAPEEIKALQDQVRSLVDDLDLGRNFQLNLKDVGGEELFGLLQNLKEAQKLGLTGDQLTLTNSLALEEEIQKRNLEIEQQRQAIQEQEKETQKQLLAIEIERNKVTAQTQIKEAEIAALRAKSAVTTAQIEAKRASSPEEAIQAQLALLQAQEEFQFALSGIDLAKQNAVITDRLAELQGGGMAIALDPDVQKIADIGKSMESIVDFSKYDQLLSQLEKAAAPLENEIGVQERAVNATNKLSTGIDLLNQKIERLVTTLGRPNIAVSGGSSVTEAIEIMRAVG